MRLLLLLSLAFSQRILAQTAPSSAPSSPPTFAITGAVIPPPLVKINYGKIPKDIGAYELNICNATDNQQSLASNEIFEALSTSEPTLRPIGRQIMLAVILRNQNHSVRSWLTLGLASTTGVLATLGANRTGMSPGLLSAISLGALIGQQLLSTWSPVLTSGQLEKFESQVLESTLLIDPYGCTERTVFTVSNKPAKAAPSSLRPPTLHFHVQRPQPAASQPIRSQR